ncbi:unnamed protein product [Strongylus vulgaris]|uniref:ABC-2 type transporter transmembrane domain-containing protein n=1 Tax=Strongylus vulgaris TaxID=40348 RepID=A0A3P7JBF4_STRVU|nr:unnamed protein product [Strongylus vulgaris]
MRGYLQFIILLFVLYFWACVPFVYTVSFMFSSPSKANVLLIIWQLVAAFAAMIVLFLLSLQETVDPSLLEIIGSILLCFLPSFAVGNAVMTVGQSSAEKLPPHLLWEWNMLGKNLTFMLIFGCFSSLLFVLFQFKSVRYRWFQIWDLRYGRRNYGKVANDEEDSAVREERIYVTESGEDLALEVKPIGYCPQFDALMLDLTGRESLEILFVFIMYVL